ncbi:hypothetical protein I3843_03G065800 [Carya illinoinensis]|nr:hypothetical protein I3843_03G065800 [Carya illinoinensis]
MSPNHLIGIPSPPPPPRGRPRGVLLYTFAPPPALQYICHNTIFQKLIFPCSPCSFPYGKRALHEAPTKFVPPVLPLYLRPSACLAVRLPQCNLSEAHLPLQSMLLSVRIKRPP